MPYLEIRDLTFTYPGGNRAVDDLNLDVQSGELVAVIGPNAAGKSTLALLLKGLLKPDRGRIRINGREWPKGESDPRVGILFANPENQIVTSIVEEDVAFNLEVAGLTSELIKGRVHSVLDRLGILHLSGRMPHLLSGGEQQMVALAGVLVQEPDILVLDEPTTYLDPDGRAVVLEALRNLVNQGKTVILVTHDMSEAGTADRVVLMDRGQVVQDDPPMQLFARRDISEAYGITPPFLIRLALALGKKGHEMAGSMNVIEFTSSLKDLVQGPKASPVPPEGNITHKEKGVPAITFEGIRFRYGLPSVNRGDLLADLDLAIPDNCVALLCGSNGSGKSTLLQMANGLITPDEGRVTFRGRSLADLRREEGSIFSRIALLFQNPEKQLFSETVFDDIAFGPRNLGLDSSEVRKRVREAARWTGLEDCILPRAVHTLSGGQMRRVAVAGVLAMEPAVLVLDEPTDNLDPGGVREFYRGVRRYCHEKGTTVIIAAHKVPEEVRVIDHFSHLEMGRIRSSGSPERILTGPGRTLPVRYLPDHLHIQEVLSDMGFALDKVALDPSEVEETVLAMVPEKEKLLL